MVISLDKVVAAHDALSDAVASVDRNNPRSDLQVLEASAVEFIVNGINRLAGIWPLGPMVADLFAPITDVLADLAGNPTAIYAHSDALERQASALREMPPSISDAVRQSHQEWHGSEGADAFRTLAKQYALVFYASADALESMAGLTNQTAVTVVKTKVAIINLVGQLLWDVISIAIKVITMPWNVFEIGRSVAAAVLSVLEQVRVFANTLAVEGNGLLGHQAGLARAMQRAGDLLRALESDRFDEHGDGLTQTMRSDGPHPDDDLMSDLIAGDDRKGPMPDGWRALTDAELAELGIDMNERDGDGFGGTVFIGPDGQLVVKMDGTDFSYAPDVIEDGIGGVTMSPQSARAMEVAEAIRQAGLGDNVVYTGSSLGGRLAAVAAMSQGGVAVTFNAAGVSPGTMAYLAAQRGISVDELYAEVNSGSVRTYVLDGEILTDLQERVPVVEGVMPDAPGQRYTVPNTPDTEHMNPVEKHTANGQIGDAMREHWPQMQN